jgi:hypothetical protein
MKEDAMNQDSRSANGFFNRLRIALKSCGSNRHQERRLQNAIKKLAIEHQNDASSQRLSRALSKRLQRFALSEEDRHGIIAKVFRALG